MKLSHSFLPMTFLSLSLFILPQHTISCYGRFKGPQRRILQTTGDLTLPANSFVISDIYTVYYQFDPADVANVTNSTDTNATNSTGTDVTNATSTDLINSTDSNLTDTTNGTLVNGTDSTNSTDIVPPLNGTNEADASNGNDIAMLPNAPVVDNTTTPAEPVLDNNNTVPGGILNATDNSIITDGTVGNNLDNITEPINGANTTDTTGNGADITNAPAVDNGTGLTNGTAANDTALTNGADTTNGTVLVNGTEVTNGTDINNATEIDNGTNTTNGTVAAGPPVYITVAINFTVPNQFFGLGWGSKGMVGGDIWSFEIEDGAVVVNDRYATGHFEPPTDVELGGTNDLEVLGYEIGETFTFVKVRRLIDTGDKYDHVIAPGKNNVIWATAVGSPTIEDHGRTKGRLQVDLLA